MKERCEHGLLPEQCAICLSAEKDEEPKKTCRSCGFVKPLHEFYRNTNCKDGYEGICKSCKKKKKKAPPKKTKPPSPKINLNHKLRLLILDVSPYPDLLEHLSENAFVNIRSLENQALFYIVRGLKEDGKRILHKRPVPGPGGTG